MIVLFLEAKTEVTNVVGEDPSHIPTWQRAVKRVALFWGYIYQ